MQRVRAILFILAAVLMAAILVASEESTTNAKPTALPKEEVQRRLNEFKAKQATKMANMPKNEVPPASGKTVIVVGGGLAGMSAAIEALRAGARVYVLERMPRLGGNSEKASSGINGAKTSAQAKLWLKDSVEEFYKDTISSGKGLSNPELVDILTKQSAEAHDFLTSFGIDLSVVTKLGGHSRARTHHQQHPKDGPVRNIGWHITSTLLNYLLTIPRDRLTLLPMSRMTSLIEENGRVVGVHYNHKLHDASGMPAGGEARVLKGDAVVLATGGYSVADDMLRKYTPSIVDLPTTNGPFAEGDGIRVAERLNASIIHMDQVQVHPTSFIFPDDPNMRTKFLAPEALRGLGGILINQDGKRFVNELDTRDKVTKAIFDNCKPMKYKVEEKGVKKTLEGPVMAYLVMIDEAVKEFPPLKFYQAKGFVTAYLGVESLAIGLKVPYYNLEQTLVDYNDCFDRKGVNCREPFGKKDFPYPTRDNDMYHVMMITPAIHYTMGGLEIDQEAHVLRVVSANATDEEGNVVETTAKEIIPGLFAAGEVTGGVHGGNRLGGNSLLECVVFGRIAGRAAAAVEEPADVEETTAAPEAEVEEAAAASPAVEEAGKPESAASRDEL